MEPRVIIINVVVFSRNHWLWPTKLMSPIPISAYSAWRHRAGIYNRIMVVSLQMWMWLISCGFCHIIQMLWVGSILCNDPMWCWYPMPTMCQFHSAFKCTRPMFPHWNSHMQIIIVMLQFNHNDIPSAATTITTVAATAVAMAATVTTTSTTSTTTTYNSNSNNDNGDEDNDNDPHPPRKSVINECD